MTGITYFCTDSHGNVYSRYSAGHRVPRYVAAAVQRSPLHDAPAPKSHISYASRFDLARKIKPWTGYVMEVIEVRAYPGRVAPTQEPARGFAFGAKPIVQVETIGESKITSQQIEQGLSKMLNEMFNTHLRRR